MSSATSIVSFKNCINIKMFLPFFENIVYVALSLAAAHDGTGNLCLPFSNYLMAPVQGGSGDLINFQYFSNCSISAIKTARLTSE